MIRVLSFINEMELLLTLNHYAKDIHRYKTFIMRQATVIMTYTKVINHLTRRNLIKMNATQILHHT